VGGKGALAVSDRSKVGHKARSKIGHKVGHNV
jgi:hypothetical protein